MKSSFSTDKSDIVTMVHVTTCNTTENKDIFDLRVNFTCISSKANPPAYNLLSDNEDGFSFSKSGTWIKKISRGGKFIYNCLAYQLVGNVTSTNKITLTVNGKWIKCVDWQLNHYYHAFTCTCILFRHHLYILFYCTNLITFLQKSTGRQH